MKLIKVFLIATASLFAVNTLAAPIYFTDRATFDAFTSGGLDFESFEANFATGATIAFTGFTVSETNGVNILGQLRGFPGVVDGAITDGTGALGYDDNGASIGTFFSFTSPITAIGLDLATNPGSTVTIGGSVSDSIALGTDTASFWGVVDFDGITSITFDASGGPGVGFDAVSYGESAIPVDIDIKFCSDPNAFNCKKKGVLPVTIFGSDILDVTDIDPSTLQLCLADLSDCTSAPKDYSMADRGDPDSDLGAAQCALVEDPPLSGVYVEQDYLTLDGLVDLDAAFYADEAQGVLSAFCDGPKKGVSPDLVVFGETFDGVSIYSVPVSNAGIDQLVKANK